MLTLCGVEKSGRLGLVNMPKEGVKPVIRPETAAKALKICLEENLPARSLSACIEAIIELVDRLRTTEKLVRLLLGTV